MPRHDRLDTPGTLHHVIIRGGEKGKIVDDHNDQQNFVDSMGDRSIQTITPYACVLMPNHAHILLRSGPKGISTFMRHLLTGYTIWYNRRHDRYGYYFKIAINQLFMKKIRILRNLFAISILIHSGLKL